MIEFLKIVIWNANSLCNRALELKSFLYSNDVDIALISETHFTCKSYLRIPNYLIYNTKHPDGKAYGGTAIIIKQNIKDCLKKAFKKDYLQATAVEIWCWECRITIASVYCPPKHAIKRQEFAEFFTELGTKFIAAGHYNAKHTYWGSS